MTSQPASISRTVEPTSSPYDHFDLARAASRRTQIRATARRTLGHRRRTGQLCQLVCWLAMLIALAPLVALVYYTVARGAGGLSLGFVLHAPTPPGIPGGGISSAIVGSAQIVGLALAMAVPVGLAGALFLFERPGRIAGGLRFSAGVLAGVPSIVIGIFVYAILIRPLHHFSDIAASFAIAVVMVPIMLRADEEAIRGVAIELWEAGIALGVRRSRVARSILVRGALPGIVTGNLLALARGAGETAPLLFTVAAPTAAMTLLILTDSTQAFSAAQTTAWATALVLLSFVLALSLSARALSWWLASRTR